MSGPLSLQGAMSAARTAVDASATEAATASQNIANAATPGYARERVSLEALANNAGVAATTIQRLVSPVIRAALVHAQGASATATAEAGFLGQIQALLGEPSQGLSSLLSSFWNAWQGVATTPSDLGARNALLSAATQLTAQFHALASGLTGMAQALAAADTAYLLRASASGGTVSVTWAANGQPVPLTGGEVGAELQTVTQTIPAVLGQLNSLALSLIQAVNAQHQVGYTLASPPRTGLPFFQGTGAADIALAPAVASTPLEIAASSSGAPNDGANAQAIAALVTTPLASGTTIAQQYNGIVVSLGAQLATATQQQTTASAQVAQFQQLDQSVSGVSLTDEQLALLLDQQQSQAASSVLQAVKAMLQSLLAAVGA